MYDPTDARNLIGCQNATNFGDGCGPCGICLSLLNSFDLVQSSAVENTIQDPKSHSLQRPSGNRLVVDVSLLSLVSKELH